MNIDIFDKENLLKDIQDIQQVLEREKGYRSSSSDDSSDSEDGNDENDQNNWNVSKQWLANPNGQYTANDEAVITSENQVEYHPSIESRKSVVPDRDNVNDVVVKASLILSNSNFKRQPKSLLPSGTSTPQSIGLSPNSLSGYASPISQLIHSKSKHSKKKSEKTMKNEDVDSSIVVTIPPSLQSKTEQQKENIKMTNLYVERIFRSFRDKSKNFKSVDIEDINENETEFVSSSRLADLEHLLQLNRKYQEFISNQLEKVKAARSHNKLLQQELDNDNESRDKISTYSALSRSEFGKFENPYFRDREGFGPPMNEDTMQRFQLLKVNATTKAAKAWRESENIALKEGVYNNNLEARITPLLAKAKALEKDYAKQAENGEVQIDRTERREIMKKVQDIKNLPQEELLKDNTDIDFFKLIRKYLPYRDEFECRIHWMNVLHPLINHNKFSKNEDTMIIKHAEEYNCRNWPIIAEKLATNRTPIQCLQRYQRSLNKDMIKKTWDKESDERLIKAVKMYGHDWVSVSNYMGDRTSNQCLFRWDKTLNPSIKRGKWSSEEDEILIAAVKKFGKGNWKRIKLEIPGRTDAQCRERYVSRLDPTLNFSPFTPEEDEKIIQCVEKHGLGKWSAIAQEFEGRQDNQIFRRYSRLQSLKYQKHKRDLWKKAAVMNNFQNREKEKPDYNLTDLEVQGTPQFTKMEVHKMEVIRRQLNKKGINKDDILSHIARLYFDGTFVTGYYFNLNKRKSKRKVQLIPTISSKARTNIDLRDSECNEGSSFSESENDNVDDDDRLLNSEIENGNNVIEHNDSRVFFKLPTDFLESLKNVITKTKNPEKELRLVDEFSAINHKICRPNRRPYSHRILSCSKTGGALKVQCERIFNHLSKDRLSNDEARKRLCGLLNNDDSEESVKKERNKIIHSYIDKLTAKEDLAHSLTELMIKQDYIEVNLIQSKRAKRLRKLKAQEESNTDIPCKKSKNVMIKKEPVEIDNIPESSTSQKQNKSKKGRRKKSKPSKFVAQIKSVTLNKKSHAECSAVRGEDKSDSEQIENEYSTSGSFVQSFTDMQHMSTDVNEQIMVGRNIFSSPENNEDSQLKTFTLLLQALHVDTRKVIQSLPQASDSENSYLPEGANQDMDEMFPKCFPLSPNTTTIAAFRTLLLHRRHLFSIVNKHYPPLSNAIPAIRDTRYRRSRSHQALMQRFKSTFFWPSFLATFTPKFISESQK